MKEDHDLIHAIFFGVILLIVGNTFLYCTLHLLKSSLV